jgi:hypothetical protein
VRPASQALGQATKAQAPHLGRRYRNRQSNWSKTMTKTLITAAALLLFASVQAADSRQHFISGNPDSDNSRGFYSAMGAMPAARSSNVDRYHGIAHDNPDLLGFELGSSQPHMRPDIYGAFGASPELSF